MRKKADRNVELAILWVALRSFRLCDLEVAVMMLDSENPKAEDAIECVFDHWRTSLSKEDRAGIRDLRKQIAELLSV